MRDIRVIIVDQAKVEFEGLNSIVGEQKSKGIENSEEMQLLNAIKKKSEIIKLNPEYGDKIPRKYWPDVLIKKYDLTNLWRVELTGYWRMLYTLKGNKLEVICFVVEINKHKEYNKIFGYRKK